MHGMNKLKIDLPAFEEVIDENSMEFVSYPARSVYLEHSLYTISNWESKWKKAFLSEKPKTEAEMQDYVYWMIVEPEMSDEDRQMAANQINTSKDLIMKIRDFMADNMTATCFMESGREEKKGKDVLTAELFYYIIFSNQINIEVEHWHINRLMALVRVFSVKNDTGKGKRSQREIMQDYERINARNRAKFHTKG